MGSRWEKRADHSLYIDNKGSSPTIIIRVRYALMKKRTAETAYY